MLEKKQRLLREPFKRDRMRMLWGWIKCGAVGFRDFEELVSVALLGAEEID